MNIVALTDKKSARSQNIQWVWRQPTWAGKPGHLINGNRWLDILREEHDGHTDLTWTSSPKEEPENFFHLKDAMIRAPRGSLVMTTEGDYVDLTKVTAEMDDDQHFIPVDCETDEEYENVFAVHDTDHINRSAHDEL